MKVEDILLCYMIVKEEEKEENYCNLLSKINIWVWELGRFFFWLIWGD